MDSSDDNSQRLSDRVGITGKRLRVNDQHRTENEYKQMLRLAEIESRELKDSLRYVEIQLAKTKENLRTMTGKYENCKEEIQSCQEHIARSSNINHAQTQQIEELSKRNATVNQTISEQKEAANLKLQ